MKPSLKQMILSRRGVAGVAVGLLLVGATLGGVANAQTPTPAAGQSPAITFIQALAKRLGLPQDQVTKAVQDARGDLLNDAVAAGRLTQAQADQIRNQPVDQGPGFGFGFAGPHGGRRGGPGVDLAAVAQRLGLSQEELRTQLESGQSLVDIAKSKSVDEQTLINQLVADAQSRTAEAVKSGKITQAQADQMNQGLADRIKQMVESTHTPGARGPMGPMGPRGIGQRGPGGQPPAPASTPSTGA